MTDASPQTIPLAGSRGSDRPILSVVVVSYNVRDLLENCLHSVERAFAGMLGEVFVVDNNSDDGSVDMVRERFPAVRLIASTRNEGFARANNLALAEARGEYLLLLNPDTLVQEDTFSVMLRFFEENKDVGMAGCRIITPDGSLEPACRRSFPSPWVSFTKLTGLSVLFPRSSILARYNLTYLSEDETYEVDAISGSFMMLRSTVYERIGGLDEEFFMYGEDLDWCYRVQQAGWKICYVHATKIIHYGGESTKRSSIDATAVFYRAMELFARKNLKLSRLSYAVITLGIKLRLGVTRARVLAGRTGAFVLDALLTLGSLTLGELLWFGEVPALPSYAYPTVQIATVLVAISALAMAGAYTRREYRVLRAALGVVLGLLLLSTMTFFFKDYAFSRAVVLIASACNILLLPGWRLLRAVLSPGGESLVTGRPTLLVGLTGQSLVVLERLRTYDAGTYRVVGLIDVTRRRLGETIDGVEVLGSIDNIGKVIAEQGVTDVIVAPDVLTYAEILSMISRARDARVSYRIVPRSMEFIVGKAGIDQLTSVPLVDVEYNLLRLTNRMSKRMLDVAVSLAGLITAYPFVVFMARPSQTTCSFRWMIRNLPRVLSGQLSLVGYPMTGDVPVSGMYAGKPGLTGLVQLRSFDSMQQEEINKLTVQYLRNHSVFLDCEILLRTFVRCMTRRSRRQ